MEEIWEFAVVSDFDDYLIEQQKLELDKPLILEDFSSQVYSVQAKFFSVAILSVFVCLFDLSSNSSFLGVTIEDLNERIIEFGLFGISLSLYVLLVLRMLEERDVFLKLDRDLEKIKSAADSQITTIKVMHDNIKRHLQASPLMDGSIIQRIDIAGY